MIDVRMTSVLIELSRHQIPMPVSLLRKQCTPGVMAAVLKDARSKGWATSSEFDGSHLQWQITTEGYSQIAPIIPIIHPAAVEADAAGRLT